MILPVTQNLLTHSEEGISYVINHCASKVIRSLRGVAFLIFLYQYFAHAIRLAYMDLQSFQLFGELTFLTSLQSVRNS